MKRNQVRWRRVALAVFVTLAPPAGWVGWTAWRRPGAVTAAMAGRRVPSRPLVRGDIPLEVACREAGVDYPPRQPRIVVAKRERTAGLYVGMTLVKEYPMGLGRRPEGDKEREGDGRTPVGEFYVCTRLGRSRWHRFLGLSYPAPEDARRGREQGIITVEQERAILAAHGERRQPPWNTPLGGEVGLHGGGSGLDWTLGCIALENEAIAELFDVLPLGTPVSVK